MPTLSPVNLEDIETTLEEVGVEDIEVSKADGQLAQLLNRTNCSVEEAVQTIRDVLYNSKPNTKLKAAETILKMHGVLGEKGNELSSGAVQILINSDNTKIGAMFHKNG
jgi:hypothetical protein